MVIVLPSPVETRNGGALGVPQPDTEPPNEAFDLAARTTAPGEARRRAAAWLRGHPVGHEALDATALILSELVTNAVMHGGGNIIGCTLRIAGGVLRIEVTDQGYGYPEPAVRRPGPDDVSGRGLLLVSTVAEAWGVVPAGAGGRTVWATVLTGK
jgi:anti-sigma regulatory factor (Ser/Thr protein kinase)